MEKLETLFFCKLSRRTAHFICTGSFCLVSLDKILSYLIFYNKNIHQVPLVSAQLAWALPFWARLKPAEKYPPGAASFRPAGLRLKPAAWGGHNNLNLKADSIIYFHSETLMYWEVNLEKIYYFVLILC